MDQPVYLINYSFRSLNGRISGTGTILEFRPKLMGGKPSVLTPAHVPVAMAHAQAEVARRNRMDPEDFQVDITLIHRYETE